MPIIVMGSVDEPKHDKTITAKIYTFLQKLREDDTTLGLHIEPINNSRDPRARTGRVNQGLRAVLFRLDPEGGERTYVYAGTWPHDEGTSRAQKMVLSVNPINGLAQFSTEAVAPIAAAEKPSYAAAKAPGLLHSHGFVEKDLTEGFGFEESLVNQAFAAPDEDTLLELAGKLPDAWRADVLLEMGAGTPLDVIKSNLSLDEPPVVDADLPEDNKLVEALKHPAAKLQFTFIEDDEELRRIIDEGDFGAWRIFLHPEQRAHVEKSRTGSFRLTGGAGTGKTVVLLHRAHQLASASPTARIILTTYTRGLAENLRRDLERLDPKITFANKLGEPGILVHGVDQLANDVRVRAGVAWSDAAVLALGSSREATARPGEADWDSAIRQAGADLTPSLRTPSFFADEYAQVILPAQVKSADDYFAVRRPGRGVALDRAKRAMVWKVVEQMRKDQRVSNTVGWGELAAISTAWLASTETTLADHVLVDEGQDLEPVKWQLLRALVSVGPNDLFIADDIHQRIYGQPTVLKRHGINIQGRSRRLTLNYRTTLENLRYAMKVLDGGEYVDEDEGAVTTQGYRSSRSGPKPKTHATKSDGAQFEAIAQDLERWLAEGVRPETIAILAASNFAAKNVQQAMSKHGIACALVTTPRITAGQPVIMTMHNAKGMEFSRVVLFDVSDGSFPSPYVMKTVTDEDREDKLRQQRSLLYVAASRARDELVVTYKGAPSELLLG